MKRIALIILVVVLNLTAKAQHTQPNDKVFYTPQDVEIFEKYIHDFKGKSNMPIGRLIAETGKYFVGTPYVNFTLEVRQPEELIVNLRELDCVTFVETSIALAQTLKSGDRTFENYCRHLRRLRYRGGILTDFTSRLHYFSDWIYDKERMGIAEDITQELGGKPYSFKVNLMSKYPKNYRQLVANPEMIPVLAEIEDSINSRQMFYIPEAKGDSLGRRLRNGYVIGTTTTTSMDIAHVGFVIIVDGKPHFMHASSTEKKVVITEGTLQKYLEGIRNMNGFMVARVKEE